MPDLHNITMIREIQDIYNELTPVEKSIADYFIHTEYIEDYSAKATSEKLYVSEASLTRFAKKCGYKGFREFVYNLKMQTAGAANNNISELIQTVVSAYRSILEKNLMLVNAQQMQTLASSISKSKRILIYGMGISGFAAEEFKFRLMRIGLMVDAVTDSHLMNISSALVNENYLVIALSISGNTREVLNAMRIAKEHEAYVVLLTAQKNPVLLETYCDEIIPVAAPKNLANGTFISPQFPLLVMLDIFYSYYLQTDYAAKASIHMETLSALNIDPEKNK